MKTFPAFCGFPRLSVRPILQLPRVRVLALVWLALVVWVQGAFAATSPTLTFDITARAVQTEGKTQSAARTMTARVLLRGEAARIESKIGEQPITILWLKPYVYRLLPKAKSGVRFKASTPMPEMQTFAGNWPSLMKNPLQIRALLKSKGAKKIGSVKINDVPTEMYSADKWNGQNRAVKLWLRQKDALPVKMESQSGNWKVSVYWRNYRRNPKLPASLFQVPKDFRIRESQPPRATL